jgi:hypothetical protein
VHAAHYNNGLKSPLVTTTNRIDFSLSSLNKPSHPTESTFLS